MNDSPVDCQSRGRPSAQFARESSPVVTVFSHGYRRGRPHPQSSVFALKTVINCFLNERHRPHQVRTQNRIQEIVPILRSLFSFRGGFSSFIKHLLRYKEPIFREYLHSWRRGIFVFVKIMGKNIFCKTS